MDRFKFQAIQSLGVQLLRGPKRLRLQQLYGIEFALSVVEPDKAYPFDFVCHALTGYRPATTGMGRLLEGEALIHDLVLLSEQLSEDASISLKSWSEPVYTVADLAERFDVSTKTIFRWRRRGLAGWKFRFEDQRLRLRFPDRSVRRFVAQKAGLVARGASFSQLSKAERAQIIARAVDLVEGGTKTVNAVARTIAVEVGRAVETIRLILKHYDEAHPGEGIFNRCTVQVEQDDLRLSLWEAYTDGARVGALAERFGRSTQWVYKTITQMRALQLKSRSIEYIANPAFEAPDADEQILRPAVTVPLRQDVLETPRSVPEALPPYLANLFRIPLLTREGEQVLFRKMNYLKYKAHKLLSQIDPDTASAVELDRIDDLLEKAAQVKNEIVMANLRLVVSIAKRHLGPMQDLFELISDGNVSLMRAVDKFDYARGFKFSTYASWAIVKNFARTIPECRRHAERYQTGWDEVLDGLGTPGTEEPEDERQHEVRLTVDRLLSSLDDRERCILRQRYGLDDHGRPQTLEQIGRNFGVSKERIRQLETRAIMKLRGGFQLDVEQLLGT